MKTPTPPCPVHGCGLIEATSNVSGWFCAAVMIVSDNSAPATIAIFTSVRISVLARFLNAINHENFQRCLTRLQPQSEFLNGREDGRAGYARRIGGDRSGLSSGRIGRITNN